MERSHFHIYYQNKYYKTATLLKVNCKMNMISIKTPMINRSRINKSRQSNVEMSWETQKTLNCKRNPKQKRVIWSFITLSELYCTVLFKNKNIGWCWPYMNIEINNRVKEPVTSLRIT